MGAKLLEVNNLSAEFNSDKGSFQVLADISFTLSRGETLGIVGESGCGKSSAAFSIMNMLPYGGKVTRGNIFFKGRDLLTLNDRDMQKIRGNNIAMIFQDPMTALNPVHTIGYQIAEALMIHKGLSRGQAMEQALEALKRVMIPMAELRLREYPFQMSGGMSQRVMIAMALICNPEVLIADEPTTALDVTIQSQIMDLLIELREELKTAILLITHNLGVIAEMAQRVAVMYAGRIVELGHVKTVLEEPLHPYTKGLLESMPGIHSKGKRLHVIRGSVPDYMNLPDGCTFHPRCSQGMELCKRDIPKLISITENHFVRCWRVKAE
ncbi:ABC transporter ATP-binding protein [Desulfitibacter alkalitolerans]|uniref:ABC transporter ATP-binding protein n=1 Tax=Desulfitibacter alkalitolerans TaxID=264641 RepID=UPI0004861AE2|nr:ABC transporter ATP-binding protein [Desulfitibacter alkalitolerans]